MNEPQQFSYPIWPAVKRVFNGWKKDHANGRVINFYETTYVTYVRKEHDGVFYLQLCVGRFMSKKYTDPDFHNQQALNELTIRAYFADKFGKINPDIINDNGLPLYEKHDDQRSEKDFLAYKFGVKT